MMGALSSAGSPAGHSRGVQVMLRRNIRHLQRYPSLTIMLIGLPVVFLLLFVFVLGNTLGAGIGVGGGRSEYLQYIVPGILLMAIASAAQGTAISMAMDMTAGIVARFRTMAISRGAVLTGHVIGSMIQSMLCFAAVLGVAVLIGFRSDAGLLNWLGAAGMVALIALAITWLSVALGITAKSVETASNTPMFLFLLPFLGSGFVPDRLDAGRHPLVRRVSALHAVHRGNPKSARRNARREQHPRLDRLVRGDRRRRLPLGAVRL